MNKHFVLIVALLIGHSSFSQTSGHVWTFDCNMEQWVDYAHSREFKKQHQLATESVNSGHLEFIHQDGDYDNWLFGPTSLLINANENKHIHFSLTVSDAGSIPENGIGALLVWTPANNLSVLHTKRFQIVNGQHDYHIDLSDHADWTGNINLNRIHFPQGDFRSEGYTPETAIYALDWFAIVPESTFSAPTQDTSSACIPEQPVLSNPESVIFGNRVSMKAIFSGNVASTRIKLWQQEGDTLFRNQEIKNEAALYFSFYDLKPGTSYHWKIEASNSEGTATTETQTLTTESQLAEEMPMKYWMTPGPFLLTENVNDHLFDQNNWEETADLVDVYKIHGAFFSPAPQFYSLNIPKLIYTINKNRMRLAWETIVQGERDGSAYANDIIQMIEMIAENGGKLEFLTWDGMMFRCFYASHTNTKFRTPEEGLEVVAEACRIVKNAYPDFEIIPLPNLPNWDVKDANGNIVPHNAGDFATTVGVPSWDYLFDIFLEKAKQKEVDINFIEIDHPFNYYHRTSREVSVQRVSAINDYCSEHDMELIHIINSTGFGEITTVQEDARFKADCMQYLQDLKEDGLLPKYIDLESWYPYPQYLTPETKENSFTNVLLDVGNHFSCISDSNGCLTLPIDNFSIETIGETCPAKNNGQLIINTVERHNYVAQYNETDYNFTTRLALDDLPPGTNELCISVESETYQQCYIITIVEGTTISGKSKTDKNKTIIDILEGTAPYDVYVNGASVLRTMSSTFEVDARHGDIIEVKTDVLCEGIFTQTIQLFDIISIYPNPSDGIFELAIPIDLEEVSIELYNYNSQLLSKYSYPINNGKAQLDMRHLSAGVYLVKVLVDTPVTLKIIKK